MNHLLKYIIIALVLSSCGKHVIRLDKVPSNTPSGAQIYVAGNFNKWDPGDGLYRMNLQEDSSYILTLPRTIGKVEYKFTRGDWSTVERNRCGNEINDRVIYTKSEKNITNVVESWADLDPIDCDSVTIVIEDIPKETLETEKIRIAGSFNAWSPGNNEIYVIKPKGKDSVLMVTIPRISENKKSLNQAKYHFVRDSVENIEADEFGRLMEARVLEFAKGDTVIVNIKQWSDRVDVHSNQVTIILTELPKSTPSNTSIYLTGNFNNWDTRQKQYKFRKDSKGLMSLNIERRKYGLSFKITRGNWVSEMVDACGNKYDNFTYDYDEEDTIRIPVKGWMDMEQNANSNIKLAIHKLPANSPENELLYLACDGNGFNPNDEAYVFEKVNEHIWLLEMPKQRLGERYKITRGSWAKQEIASNGTYIENHYLEGNCEDTIFIEIEKWNDLMDESDFISRVWVRQVPENTPLDSRIYLTGEFNDWVPMDKNYRLNESPRGYYIDIPVRWLAHGFKFTYDVFGTWESNKRGRQIENRHYNGKEKEIEFEIKGWE